MTDTIVGKRFGRLLVLEEAVAPRRIRVVCDCGAVTTPFRSNVTRGLTTSCGCGQRKAQSLDDGRRKHGLSKTPTWHVWVDMRRRCYESTNHAYRHYGGRGITVCERWLEFSAFLEDMGERPSGMTLDRIDVNGNYEPSNCRWATDSQQMRNRRDSSIWCFGELEFVTQDEAAAYLGVSQSRISQLVKARRSGWTKRLVYG